jgi:hypothetical protein
MDHPSAKGNALALMVSNGINGYPFCGHVLLKDPCSLSGKNGLLQGETSVVNRESEQVEESSENL